MPAKPFDIKDFIKSLKLSAEDEKVAESILTKPDATAEIQRGWNSQSESSRLVDEANTIKTAAATEKAEADRIRAEAVALDTKNKSWAEALKKYEPDFIKTKEERDALAQQNADYEKYLVSIGVEPTYALEGRQPIKPVPPTKEPPVIEPVKPAAFDEETLAKLGYIKREEVGRAATLLADLPFEVTVLNQRHMELYGKPIPATELQSMKGVYLDPANTRSLSDIAAERLHFADRQTELDKIAFEERVNKEVQEKLTAHLSQYNLPSAGVDLIQPNLDSVVHFSSKEFSENAKRTGDRDTGVSDTEMQEFLRIDRELAQQGIRPGF